MKLLISLLIATCLNADSKADNKALAAKVSQLQEALREATNERMADEKRAEARATELHKENAVLGTENNAYRGKIASMTEAITALQSQLRSQVEASKIEAGAVKSLADHAATSNAAAVATVGAAVKVATIATARQVQNSKALDRNADLTQQIGDQIVALQGLTSKIASNQVSDHMELNRHRQLLEHQAKMDSWLLYLTYFVGGIFIAMVGALIYYLRFVHE
jgi:hypothetical protein